MRVLKLRESWNHKDDTLVLNNRFTKQGAQAYWKAMDASFKFNLKKHEDFITRFNFRALKAVSEKPGMHVKKRAQEGISAKQSKLSVSEDTDEDHLDPVCNFFVRHKQGRFHWSNNQLFHGHGRSRNRFILPRRK